MVSWIKKLEERGELHRQLSQIKNNIKRGQNPVDISDTSFALKDIFENPRLTPDEVYLQVSGYFKVMPSPEQCQIDLTQSFWQAIEYGHQEAACIILRYQNATKTPPDLDSIMLELIKKRNSKATLMLAEEFGTKGLLDKPDIAKTLAEQQITPSQLYLHLKDFYFDNDNAGNLEPYKDKALECANKFLDIHVRTTQEDIEYAQKIYNALDLDQEFQPLLAKSMISAGKYCPHALLKEQNIDLSLGIMPLLESKRPNIKNLDAATLAAMLDKTTNPQALANTILALTFCRFQPPFSKVVDYGYETADICDLNHESLQTLNLLLDKASIAADSSFEKLFISSAIAYYHEAYTPQEETRAICKAFMDSVLKKVSNPFSVEPEKGLCHANIMGYAIYANRYALFDDVLKSIDLETPEGKRFLTTYPDNIPDNVPQTPLEHACVKGFSGTETMLLKMLSMDEPHALIAEMIDKAIPQNRYLMMEEVGNYTSQSFAKKVAEQLKIPIDKRDEVVVIVTSVNDRFEDDSTEKVYATCPATIIIGGDCVMGRNGSYNSFNPREINIDASMLPDASIFARSSQQADMAEIAPAIASNRSLRSM